MTYYNEHSKVWVSVDVIIFGFDESKLKILIGRRQMDPGRGQWSLYGGFVGADDYFCNYRFITYTMRTIITTY